MTMAFLAAQEDFLACMKMRMANILGEAEAVVAAMAVQNRLRRQSGTPLNLSHENYMGCSIWGPCCALRPTTEMPCVVKCVKNWRARAAECAQVRLLRWGMRMHGAWKRESRQACLALWWSSTSAFSQSLLTQLCSSMSSSTNQAAGSC